MWCAGDGQNRYSDSIYASSNGEEILLLEQLLLTSLVCLIMGSVEVSFHTWISYYLLQIRIVNLNFEFFVVWKDIGDYYKRNQVSNRL